MVYVGGSLIRMAFLCLKLQSQNVGVVRSLPRNTPSSAQSSWRCEGAPVEDGPSHRSQKHAGHVQDYDRGSEDPIRRAFPTRYDRRRRASGHKCEINEITHQAKNGHIRTPQKRAYLVLTNANGTFSSSIEGMCVCWYLFNDNVMPFAVRLKSCDACKFARSVSTDVPSLDASKGHEIMNQILRLGAIG
jgi:hypothetical protein